MTSNPRKSKQPNLSDLGLTEEEADEILNKEQFLSNMSNDYDSLQKKNDGSMVEFEEISRNLLNSDFEPSNLLNSIDKSNEISDKELDNLLSSGFKSLDDGSTFKVNENLQKSREEEAQKVGETVTGLSKLTDFSGFKMKNKLSEETVEMKNNSNIRDTLERVISIESSIVKGNNSDLKVLTSEIGEFDTGNFLGGSDAVITSQDALDPKDQPGANEPECIPEAASDEDSDEGDFIDRRSRVDLVKGLQGNDKDDSQQDSDKTEAQKDTPDSTGFPSEKQT